MFKLGFDTPLVLYLLVEVRVCVLLSFKRVDGTYHFISEDLVVRLVERQCHLYLL